jgi:hypothetical protein
MVGLTHSQIRRIGCMYASSLAMDAGARIINEWHILKDADTIGMVEGVVGCVDCRLSIVVVVVLSVGLFVCSQPPPREE